MNEKEELLKIIEDQNKLINTLQGQVDDLIEINNTCIKNTNKSIENNEELFKTLGEAQKTIERLLNK